MGVAREPLDPKLTARRQMAGRVGFIMGCIAAVVAAGINFVRAPRPLSPGIALLIVLVAALNIPLGIAIGLVGERLSRRVER